MNWTEGIQKAVDYIEEHITETVNYDTVAAQSFSSSYHFQRVFSIICGFTVGEYIRRRRLTLAGEELAAGEAKIIDIALKYGYKNPDSFAKAFRKFHGILPSEVRLGDSNLNSFSRLCSEFFNERRRENELQNRRKRRNDTDRLRKAIYRCPIRE